jgi:hypothetical protein
MPDIAATVITPSQLKDSEAGGFDLKLFDKRYLAQGDSWFSIGHFPPWSTTNILFQLMLSRSSVIVDCARPGQVLAHMTNTTTQHDFLRLLRDESHHGKFAIEWDAILLSGGGNDLIDAAQAPKTNPLDQRLLLSGTEGPDPNAVTPGSAFISEAGWTAFCVHLGQVFDVFLGERDRGNGPNKDKPVLFHSYDLLTPRNAPAGPLGPWLFKALTAYGIPAGAWQATADELLKRLRTLLREIIAARPGANLHLVDTQGPNGTLVRAVLGSQGVSGDWENEIHPTPHGYSLLAQQWRPVIDALP